MTRLVRFIVRNWPLKVAAVILATLLYAVLVLARDAQQIPVTIPIDPRGQAEDATLLSPLGQVTRVRFIAPPDVTVNSASFIAWVNLAGSALGDGTRTVNVQVEAVDPRIRPLEWEPRQVRVTLDRVETRRVPIEVDLGNPPEGLDVRRPEVEPETAVIRGASSVVRRVDRAVASVSIDPAGLDLDRDVQLVPVDAVGVAVQQVEVEPTAARVRVAVIKNGETRALPVEPVPVGEPAPGFELATISVEPRTVTVAGDADQLAALTRISTEAIALDGATQTIDRAVELALPTGIVAVGDPEVRVVITFRPKTGSRTLTAGLVLEGALPDRSYTLSVREVLVTIGGSEADLARFVGSTFQVEVPVTGRQPGRHDIEIGADLPVGLALLSVSPRSVIVTIGEPAVPAAPSASPAATGAAPPP